MGRRLKRAALLALGLTILAVLALTVVELPTRMPPTREPGERGIRIAAANLALDNDQPARVGSLLGELDVDLLILLEWTGTNAGENPLARGQWQVALDEPRPNAYGLRVLVRRPLEARAAATPTPVVGPCPLPLATVRLRVGSTWLGVIGVHAPPPVETCEETNAPTLSFLAGLVADGRLREDFGVARRGERVVLAGDFNALPGTPEMLEFFASGLVDAQRRRSWRPLGTWSGSLFRPHLERIDYLLVPRDLEVRDSWTVNLPGSDHRAVIAELAGF